MKQYISFAILLELLRKQKVTAKYLSQKFEISVRSVYRYLNELESAGIPTFTIVGKNGGIGIEK
ncbi:MAG: HTH domain-containing protein, partial [Clostridia bacterium]|nr:HTH domain-containing protein [Clostridia bacterium]